MAQLSGTNLLRNGLLISSSVLSQVSGLAVSPYYFCKIVRPVVTYLPSLGIRLSVYVDAFILLAEPRVFIDHVDCLLHTLQDLGWTINPGKSNLATTYCKNFLGLLC